MANRVNAGIAAATLVVVVGLAALSWCRLLTISLLALGGLILVGTFAPRLPLLHALPFVGAVRPNVSLAVAGRYRDGVIYSVGIYTPTRLDDAAINFIVPADVTVQRSTQTGDPIADGNVLTTVDEFGPGTNQVHWNKYLEIRRGHAALYFTLSSASPQTIPVRLKLDSEKLYRERVVDAEVSLPGRRAQEEESVQEAIDAELEALAKGEPSDDNDVADVPRPRGFRSVVMDDRVELAVDAGTAFMPSKGVTCEVTTPSGKTYRARVKPSTPRRGGILGALSFALTREAVVHFPIEFPNAPQLLEPGIYHVRWRLLDPYGFFENVVHDAFRVG